MQLQHWWLITPFLREYLCCLINKHLMYDFTIIQVDKNIPKIWHLNQVIVCLFNLLIVVLLSFLLVAEGKLLECGSFLSNNGFRQIVATKLAHRKFDASQWVCNIFVQTAMFPFLDSTALFSCIMPDMTNKELAVLGFKFCLFCKLC